MSAKTVAEKLHIKPGMEISFFNQPDNLDELLGGLPDDITIAKELENTNLDLMLAFIEDRQMLEAYLFSLRETIADDGALWLAYHTGSTDMNRHTINEYEKTLGLKGVAFIAITNNWSGLRLKKV
ncbi:MAG: hypothetical protein U5J63_16905 [Fodinibius sp.]|nr:hypothetical protein [Fodinibius sp.]